MPDELPNLNENDRLKAENDFLKMKIMLQHGGHFGANEKSDSPLPPEIENQFLNNILAFEKQFGEHKRIKVFDKIGKPEHFKPVAEIPDAEIKEAWGELRSYMNGYNVVLDVCSPNISTRELYRFAMEELFDHEMDDIDLPGWSTNFIYDEFHPDPVYDNSRLVEQDLFNDIFSKRDLFAEIYYPKDGFTFNGKLYENFKTFSEKINRFKSLFDDIEMKEFVITKCLVGGPECFVEGNFQAAARLGIEETLFAGDFNVKLAMIEGGYWELKEISINGFNPD